MKTALLAVAALALATTACGGTSLSSLCQRTAQVQCQKLYECAASFAAQQGFTSESDCVTKTTTERECAKFDTLSCTGVDFAPINRCLDDMAKLACTATAQPDSCKGASFEAAQCSLTDGQVVCSSHGASASSDGCSKTYERCGDGKAYAVTCAGGSCTCTVDGQTTKTYSGGCGDTADVNTRCGWNLR